MRLIGFENSDLKVSKIDSLGELQELRTSGVIDLILDENIEAPDSYFLLQSTEQNIRIGIASVSSGQNSGIINLENKNLVYNDQCWFLFDSEGKLISQADCEGVIYEVVPDKSGFIIIHEIGAIRFSLDGKILWKINSCLVEDYRVEKDNLVLFSGGIADFFNKENGKKFG